MDCTDFQLAINSPRLKRVVAHWLATRGNRLLPAWQDIRPAGMKAELPIVWSYRYDAMQDEFIGGLAGDAIQRLLGRKIKDERLADTHKMDCRTHIPSWSDIRPSLISQHLPIVWSYKFDRKTGNFTGRLAGDRITQLFGRSFRELPLAEVHPAEAFRSIYALCERVVLEPAMYRCRGRVFKHLGRHGSGERIMLPLSDDGITANGILGATEYHYNRNFLEVCSDLEAEEFWISVRPTRQPLAEPT